MLYVIAQPSCYSDTSSAFSNCAVYIDESIAVGHYQKYSILDGS